MILLIAACLTPKEVKRLAGFAKGLGLEVLLELHGENELEHICDETELIGINNRDLKTFEVNIGAEFNDGRKIPGDKIKIAESGISSVDDIMLFKENGFKGFLIGELFYERSRSYDCFCRICKHSPDHAAESGRFLREKFQQWSKSRTSNQRGHPQSHSRSESKFAASRCLRN